MQDTKRRLLWHGMFLFLLGLLTGTIEQRFENVRMGLAAHVQGVLNGTFLVALGAAWAEVRLPPRRKTIAYWTALCGTYGNWLTAMLAAIFATTTLAPVLGAARDAAPWQEVAVTVVAVAGALAIVVSAVLVLWGLRRNAVA